MYSLAEIGSHVELMNDWSVRFEIVVVTTTSWSQPNCKLS